jgi:hypothetical protein
MPSGSSLYSTPYGKRLRVTGERHSRRSSRPWGIHDALNGVVQLDREVVAQARDGLVVVDRESQFHL